jgi:PAS domain S-box-containing protein
MEDFLTEHLNYLDASIKTAQYLSGLTTQQDIWSETGKVLINFFAADLSAFGERRPDGEVAVRHWTFSERYSGRRDLDAEIRETIAEVLESGFLSSRIISTPDPLSVAILPITRENRVIAVMVAGHLMSETLPKGLLNVYLAVVGLVGSTAQRLASERELRIHRSHLEELVKERTAELTEANEQLQWEIKRRRGAEETLRLERDNLTAIFEAIQDEIYIVDPKGQIIYGNSALEKEFGPYEGRRCHEYLNDFKEPCSFCHLRDVLAGETVRWERFFPKNGKTYDVIETPMTHSNEIFKLTIFRDITERKRMEEALRQSVSLLTATLESTADGILVVDGEGKIVNCNERFAQMWRIPEDVLASNSDDRVLAFVLDQLSDPGAFVSRVRELYHEPESESFDVLHFKDGRVFERYSRPQRIEDRVVGRVWSFRDVTAQKQAEADRLAMERRLLHGQKLESLGVLAGGIAHDFNNLLAVIVAGLELAQMRLPQDSPIRSLIDQPLQASQRAASLIRQMLAYAGKGLFFLKEIDLNDIVSENAELFRTSVAGNSALEITTTPGLPSIKADQGQVQQVIMNLILNAAEAIGANPGVIILRTGIQECDEEYLKQSRVDEKPPGGTFVFLEVSDTGCGMDEETMRRLFEPFFTTKFMGRGLGMASVQGIIRTHKGAILLESEAGRGSTFRILFPVSTEGTEATH